MNSYWIVHASAQKWLTEKRQSRWQLLHLKNHTYRITSSVHCIFAQKFPQYFVLLPWIPKGPRHFFKTSPPTLLSVESTLLLSEKLSETSLSSYTSINASSAARALRPTFKLVFNINVTKRLSGKIFANATFCQYKTRASREMVHRPIA